MKISIVLVCGILAPSSAVVKALTECVEKIDTAQACVKTCGRIASTNKSSTGQPYGNMLLECIDQQIDSNRSQHLESCCNMNSYNDTACGTSMQEAESCLTNDLSIVQEKSAEYLTCIYDKYTNNECPLANWCVSLLTGGHEVGSMNDFGVGNESNLAELSYSSETCDDMNVFGSNACSVVSGCCDTCADKIAGVVNAVIDDLLLPAYSNLTDCAGNKTCADYTTSAARQLDIADGSVVGPTTIGAANSVDVTGLASECNGDLIDEIVLYNETYAANNFLECLYKKTGKIAAETDSIAQKESSSILFSSGATSMALSAIVFTGYAVAL